MKTDQELSDLMHSVTQKSLQIMDEIKEQPEQLPALVNQYIDLTEHFQTLLEAVTNNPENVWEAQMAYWNEFAHLAHNQFTHWLEGESMPINDSRFKSDDWQHNPFFNVLSQHYLLASDHMGKLLENMEFEDPKQSKRLHFFMKQYLDAISPTNFIHSNPELIKETVQSSGKNLLKGLHNFLSDLEVGSSQFAIKMTDPEAFKIGTNIATTPGHVIYRNKMMELIQYAPQTPKVKSIPLLIIPPWINKYYILDLSPYNSLIGWLVEQGITVFVISWVNPDSSFAKKSLYDYLKLGPKSAINVIKKQLKVKKVNTLGFCIGGTLLTLLLAYNKAHKDNSIASATFLASLIDFSDPGDISVYIDEAQISKLEQEMQKLGYLPGKTMASSFSSLRANDLIWSFFIKNYLSGKNPVPFDLLYWNADPTNMPATMHSQYLRWMYLQNDLIKPRKIKLNGTPIDIQKINTPTFFLSTQKDHIAPWESVYKGFQMMKGPKRFVLGGSGHIAGIINPTGSKKYGYKTNNKSDVPAEKWLAHAKEHAGSWWPEWHKWLKTYSGTSIAAPNIEKLPYKPIMDAPGSYVLVKS